MSEDYGLYHYYSTHLLYGYLVYIISPIKHLLAKSYVKYNTSKFNIDPSVVQQTI